MHKTVSFSETNPNPSQTWKNTSCGRVGAGAAAFVCPGAALEEAWTAGCPPRPSELSVAAVAL